MKIKRSIKDFKKNLELELEFERELEFYIEYLKMTGKEKLRDNDFSMRNQEFQMSKPARKVAETVSDLNAPPTKHTHILLSLIEDLEKELEENMAIILGKKTKTKTPSVLTVKGLPRKSKKVKPEKVKPKKVKKVKLKKEKPKKVNNLINLFLSFHLLLLKYDQYIYPSLYMIYDQYYLT